MFYYGQLKIDHEAIHFYGKWVYMCTSSKMRIHCRQQKSLSKNRDVPGTVSSRHRLIFSSDPNDKDKYEGMYSVNIPKTEAKELPAPRSPSSTQPPNPFVVAESSSSRKVTSRPSSTEAPWDPLGGTHREVRVFVENFRQYTLSALVTTNHLSGIR